VAQRLRCPVCRAPLELVANNQAIEATVALARSAPLRKLEAVIRDHVLTVLQAKQGNRHATAEALGVNTSTLYRWLTAWRSQSASPKRRNEK